MGTRCKGGDGSVCVHKACKGVVWGVGEGRNRLSGVTVGGKSESVEAVSRILTERTPTQGFKDKRCIEKREEKGEPVRSQCPLPHKGGSNGGSSGEDVTSRQLASESAGSEQAGRRGELSREKSQGARLDAVRKVLGWVALVPSGHHVGVLIPTVKNQELRD